MIEWIVSKKHHKGNVGRKDYRILDMILTLFAGFRDKISGFQDESTLTEINFLHQDIKSLVKIFFGKSQQLPSDTYS